METREEMLEQVVPRSVAALNNRPGLATLLLKTVLSPELRIEEAPLPNDARMLLIAGIFLLVADSGVEFGQDQASLENMMAMLNAKGTA